jgi:hypothetical protein
LGKGIFIKLFLRKPSRLEADPEAFFEPMSKASLRPDTTSSLLRFEPLPPEFCVALLMAFVAWFIKFCPLRFAVIDVQNRKAAAMVFI